MVMLSKLLGILSGAELHSSVEHLQNNNNNIFHTVALGNESYLSRCLTDLQMLYHWPRYLWTLQPGDSAWKGLGQHSLITPGE